MLRIDYADYEALRAHGEETYPHECCGVLLGRARPDGNHVRALVRAGNTRTDSAHNRYNIAPVELITDSAAGARAGAGYCGVLPLASGPSGAVVDDGLCRGALAGLQLRDHERGEG